MTSVCARCPKVLGTSCCQVQPGEQLATLTWTDADRVGVRHTEWEWLSDAEAAQWRSLHAAWGGYFGGPLRRLTLKRRDGACVLLGPTGCVLTEADRPTACRLYPFEVRAGGDWGLQLDRFGGVDAARASGEHACLAVEEAGSFVALFEAFGTTREAVEALHTRLQEEARAHQRREQAEDRQRGS